MALRHDTTEPRAALWGTDHTTGDESEGDVLTYTGGEWVAGSGSTGEVLMTTGVVPPDPLLNSAGTDWMYES